MARLFLSEIFTRLAWQHNLEKLTTCGVVLSFFPEQTPMEWVEMSREEQIRIDDQMETSRRKFLKSASAIAVYTPPAMLVMSQPSYGSIRTSGGNRNFQNLSLQRQEIRCTRAAGPWTKNIVARFCRLF